jgi:hypothetical protein
MTAYWMALDQPSKASDDTLADAMARVRLAASSGALWPVVERLMQHAVTGAYLWAHERGVSHEQGLSDLFVFVDDVEKRDAGFGDTDDEDDIDP